MPSASQNTMKTTDLKNKLTALGLRRIAEEFEDFIARATRKRFSPTQILEEIVRLESEERARRSVERRLSRARLGRVKTMADFDWSWPKKIDRTTLERILTLEFAEKGENVVLVASQGLGKTMIAKNIAHHAVLAGKSALFVTASDLLLDLSKNGGGLLPHAVTVSGFFLREGEIVGVEDARGRRQELEDRDEEILYSGPLVVHTSRASASATEILAGALKDYRRAVIAGGEHTFGKGTVQTVVEYPRGRSEGAIKSLYHRTLLALREAWANDKDGDQVR